MPYIYILTGKSLEAEGLLKIGHTTRTPNERLKEINSATAVPASLKYRVAKTWKVEDSALIERKIHKALSSCRDSYGKEFFRVSLDKAEKLINEIVSRESDDLIAEKERFKAEEQNRRNAFNFKVDQLKQYIKTGNANIDDPFNFALTAGLDKYTPLISAWQKVNLAEKNNYTYFYSSAKELNNEYIKIFKKNFFDLHSIEDNHHNIEKSKARIISEIDKIQSENNSMPNNFLNFIGFVFLLKIELASLALTTNGYPLSIMIFIVFLPVIFIFVDKYFKKIKNYKMATEKFNELKNEYENLTKFNFH